MIYTNLLEIYSFCLADFGNKFCINDKNGEDNLIYCIKLISKDKNRIAKTDITSPKFKLKSDDKLTFKGIKRMTELNNCMHINVEILSYDTVLNEVTSNYSEFISRGIMIEVKTKYELNFTPLNKRFETHLKKVKISRIKHNIQKWIQMN